MISEFKSQENHLIKSNMYALCIVAIFIWIWIVSFNFCWHCVKPSLHTFHDEFVYHVPLFMMNSFIISFERFEILSTIFYVSKIINFFTIHIFSHCILKNKKTNSYFKYFFHWQNQYLQHFNNVVMVFYKNILIHIEKYWDSKTFVCICNTYVYWK